MKIQSLHIENIASFEDATVSFDSGALGDADVFLICGAVGTGKSTILDCITLALYGCTPRLKRQGRQSADRDLTFNGSRITDPKQLLRRGTPRGHRGRVTLLFQADGHDYEAVWQTPSTQKGARTLTDLTTHTVRNIDKEVDAEIRRLLNLDFEQFCRTTTLSQGEFAKFLRSDDDEKAAILEKIVGVEIYSRIGAMIFEKTAQAKREAELAESRIAGLQLIGAEQLDAIREELKTLGESTAALAARSKDADEKIAWLTHAAGLAARQASAAEELHRAREERDSADYAAKAQTVADYDATADARAALLSIAALSAKAEATERELRLDSDAFAVLLGRLDALESDTRRLEQEKAALLTQLESYRKYETVSESLGILRASADDYAAATKSTADTAAGIKKMREDIDTRLRPCADAARSATAKARELATAAQKLLADAIHTATLRDLPSLDTRIAEAADELKRRRKAVAEAELAHEALVLSTSRGVRQLRGTLKSGCRCPVCLQSVGALPADVETVLQQSLEASRSLLDTLRADADATNDALTRLASESKALADELAAGIDIPAGNTPSLLDGHCGSTRLKALRADLDRARTALIAAQATQAKAESRLAKNEEKMAELQGALSLTRANTDAACRRIVGIAATTGDTESALANADPQAFVAEMEKRCSELERLKNAVSLAETTLTARRELLGRLHTKKDRITALLAARCPAVPTTAEQPEAATLEAEFDALLADAGVAVSRLATLAADKESASKSLVDFTAASGMCRDRLAQLAALKPSDISSLRKDIEATASRVDKAEGGVRQCAVLTADHEARRPATLPAVDAPSVEELTAEKTAADNRLDELRRRAGALTQKLEADTASRAERGKLLEEHTRLAAVYAEWKELCDMLGDKTGSRFRRIALSFVLDNLIEQANTYMARLTDRYTLSLKPGSFIILVRDAYQGYAERATTTISGGETFMVSLALALALSDIGGNARGADILFIDEGFGSLSGEDLHNAVDMLRNLQKSAGRRVGIISHIPELAERIGVQLRVSRIGRTAASEITVIG